MVAGIAVLGRRVSISGFDFQQFWTTVRRGDPRWLALATTLTLVSYGVRALRWRVMVLPLNPAASLTHVISGTAIGYAAVILVGRAGELVRPFLISRSEKVSFPSQLAAWILERIYDLLVVLLLLGLALSLVSYSPEASLAKWISSLNVTGYLIATLAVLCLVAIGSLNLFADKLTDRLLAALSFLEAHHQQKAALLIASIMAGFRSTHRAALVLQMFAFSLLEWAILIVVFLCLFWAFPETGPLSLTKTLLLMCLTSLGGIVQLPAVGGGPQLAATLVLTEVFGLSLETASGIALVLWSVNFLSIVPVGAVYAFRAGFGWRSLRQLEKEIPS